MARCALAVCVVAVAFGLVGTSRAGAAWTHYVNVVKQQDVQYPLVEMDPAGDAVFVWMQGRDTGDQAIYTRVRAADGTFSPIQRIAGDSGSYDLAVDPDGDAYYVWRHRDSSGREYLRTRVRLADGTLGPVQTLKSVQSGDYIWGSVGVDASGTAVYAWSQRHLQEDEPYLLQARTRSPSGTLGAVHDIASGDNLTLAVDASGNATLGWDGIDGQVGMFTRVLAANGDLGPVTKVSSAGRFRSDGQVVVASSGRALFGWSEYDSDSGTYKMLVRARSADGDFQPPQVVVSEKPDDFQPGLQVGIGPTGKGVIAWRTGDAWRARTRAPGGALGATKTITPAFVFFSDLGIDSQGNVVFAWTRRTTDGKDCVFVRSERADGTLGPTRVLSLAGYNAYWPDLAVNSAGEAAVVWQEGRSGFAIQASFGS